MENILNTINDIKLLNEFAIIDANIICESLNCKLLQDLAKQLQDIRDEHQKYLDKEDEERKERGYFYRKSTNYSKKFKDIFGRLSIAWDKITDSDIEKITFSEEVDKKQDKRIRDVLKGKDQKIIIIKDKNDKQFLYFIDNWGYVITLFKNYSDLPGERKAHYNGRTTKDLTQAEKVDLCHNRNVYIINYPLYNKEAADKQRDRINSRDGMIMLDPESLKRIAENNVKRYKEIIRKNKANNINNNKLLNEVKQVIQQAATYTTMVAKDPIRHADLIADVSKLSVWIYDKQRYISGTSIRNPGYYSGVDGLLPTMMSYTKVLAEVSKNGGYEYQQKELFNTQKKMEKALEECKKVLEEIDKKLDI